MIDRDNTIRVKRKQSGKPKIGKSCLYTNRLADVDISVLREIIEKPVEQVVSERGR
ncbi:MAG: hypothetical protein ACFFE1_17195 [Candidatus Thorarchaeota archaeon]